MIKIMTRPLKYFSCFVYIYIILKRCRCIENEQLMIQYIQREYKIYARIRIAIGSGHSIWYGVILLPNVESALCSAKVD